MSSRRLVRSSVSPSQSRLVKGLPVGSAPSGAAFTYNFEQDAPDIADSYTSYAYEFGAARSTDQASEGTYSLKIDTQTFSQIEVYNDTDDDKFGATVDEGRVTCDFYIQSYAPGTMLFQIDGKSNNGPLDTNDTIKVQFTERGGAQVDVYNVSFRNDINQGFDDETPELNPVPIGQWATMDLRWKRTGSPNTVEFRIDDTLILSFTTALPTFLCNAWHHFSIGNDKSTAWSTAMYIDNFKCYADSQLT